MEQPHANQTVLREQSTFVWKKCAKLGAFFIMCMGHHGQFVRYNESIPKAYARDPLGPKSMFPPGFTVKKWNCSVCSSLEAGSSRTCSGRPRTGAVPTKRTVLVYSVLVRTNQTRPCYLVYTVDFLAYFFSKEQRIVVTCNPGSDAEGEFVSSRSAVV